MPQQAQYAPASTNGSVPHAGTYNLFAVLGFIFSLVAILLFFVGLGMVSLILEIAALVLGILSRKQFTQYGAAAGNGRGLATASIVISAVFLAIILLAMIACGAVLGAALGAASSYK